MHSGKTYIITGCASGIGAETARMLKAAGARVVGLDLNDCANVDEFHKVDLSDAASIDAAVDAITAGADGLANIAGVPPTAAAEVVMKVNLIGLIRLTERLVPKLADNASIVNIASLAGFGWADALDQVKAALELDFASDLAEFCETHGLVQNDGRAYSLSKEAVVVWTMQSRWNWLDRGIRMNSVSPGPVVTPIHQDFLDTLGERAKEDAEVMDRPGAPEDIAPVVAFLLSSETTWFRGANLPLDGGMSSHILSNIHGF